MSRYIDADALIAEMEDCSYETWSKGINRTWWAQAVNVKDNIKECIKSQPTADVVEVRHGHWITRNVRCLEIEVKCSVCGSRDFYPADYKNIRYPNYCGDCGAKMDGGKERGK